MLIRWLGPQVTRRIIAHYTWGPENGWLTEVADADAAMVLGCDERLVRELTEPAGRPRKGQQVELVEAASADERAFADERAPAGGRATPPTDVALEEQPEQQEDER